MTATLAADAMNLTAAGPSETTSNAVTQRRSDAEATSTTSGTWVTTNAPRPAASRKSAAETRTEAPEQTAAEGRTEAPEQTAVAERVVGEEQAAAAGQNRGGERRGPGRGFMSEPVTLDPLHAAS